MTSNKTDAPALIEGGKSLEDHVRDFRWRARQCRTNLDAFDPSAAAVWDFAADALEGKS